MITLYIKTHRITGLKYFGKTTRSVEHYRGSGKFWKRHIKKHGYDCETEIVGIFEDDNEAIAAAIQFSQDHDIVNSPDWANLREENGMDGAPKGLKRPDLSERWLGSKRPEISKAMTGRKRAPFSEEWKRKIGKSMSLVPRTEEWKRKIGDAHRGRKNPEMSERQRGKKRLDTTERQSLDWIIFFPDGNKQNIRNLKKFCLENGLSPSAMSRVAKGEVRQHKGYRCEKC